MASFHGTLALVLAASVAMGAVACKQGDSSSNAAPSASALLPSAPTASAKPVAKRLPNGQCPPPGSTCNAGEFERYTSCIDDKCDPSNRDCLGSGYQAGIFDGPCKDYMTCSAACACDDSACMKKCAPNGECRACLGKKILPCIQGSGCEIPACATPAP